MPRNKVRKTNRSLFTAELMKRAVDEVIEKKKAIRAVAKDMGLSRATLSRYVTDTRTPEERGTTVNFKKTHVTKQVNSLQWIGCFIYQQICPNS